MGDPTILGIDTPAWERLRLAARVIAPADPVDGHALILAALRAGATVTAAVEGTRVVGLAVVGPPENGARELLAVGVAPAFRQRGLAEALLVSAMTARDTADVELRAEVTLAERDAIEPLERGLRAEIARRLLEVAGFEIRPADRDQRQADPDSLRGVRPAIA